MKSTNGKTFEKMLVIVGPTAAGKSDLAILLARAYNGEIISADSRQVYRGMDVGSGKVPRDLSRIRNQESGIKKNQKESNYISGGIRHHLLDVASPKRSYNVTHFVRDAKKAITDIKKRGKLPIICGGTGFWIQALVEDTVFPKVRPDAELREKLSNLSAEKLFSMLKKKDRERAATIDAHNKVRLVRALEIIATLGKVPIQTKSYKLKAKSYIIIALNPNKETLRKNIEIRLKKRLKKGMVSEVKRLHTDGVSWKRLEGFGLEYKNVAFFLQKKITRETMQENLRHEICHYAKRQLSYLRRFEKMGAHIHWVTHPKETTKLLKSLDISIIRGRVL